MSSGSDLILYVAAVFFPPFSVVVKRGCGFQLLLNIILCCFGWIPGILHAAYIVAATPSGRRPGRYDYNHPRPSSSGKHSHHSRPDHSYGQQVPVQQGYYAPPGQVPVGYVYPQPYYGAHVNPGHGYPATPPPKY